MKKLIVGSIVVGSVVAGLVPFIAFATPVSCSISFAPIPANTLTLVTGTFVGNAVQGTVSFTRAFLPGSYVQSFTEDNGLKCTGTVVAQ